MYPKQSRLVLNVQLEIQKLKSIHVDQNASFIYPAQVAKAGLNMLSLHKA